MDADLYLHCPECAQIRRADAPPCADGHGADCPERACAACGAALFVDPTTAGERHRPAARHAARHAA